MEQKWLKRNFSRNTVLERLEDKKKTKHVQKSNIQYIRILLKAQKDKKMVGNFLI